MENAAMPSALELLRTGRRDQIWRKYCGFLDMDVAEVVRMQDELLREQLGRLGKCELGRRLMGGTPSTVEEFRATVPTTTYRDYAAYLIDKREDVLPEKPYDWVHTSGRSGEYEYKWIPYTQRMYEISGENAMTCFLLAASRRKGEIRLKPGMSFLYTVAPRPYMSGLMTDSLMEQFPFSVFPSPEAARDMAFQTRIQEAFRLALSEGLDFFYGVTSILLKISEQFSQAKPGSGGAMAKGLTPKAVLRLGKAAVKAFLHGRPIQPRDIWNVKGAVCGGMDTSIFKERVAASWGVDPLEAYGTTEFGAVATQAWNREGMSFFPDGTYFEFMPEADYRKMRKEPGYRPPLYRLDQVRAEQDYVLVGTSFHGGALVRYIIGDLVRIVATEDRDAGIRLPQAVFVARIDDLIDIGGFTRLTEGTIWRALEYSGVGYVEWTVRKEYEGKEPVLHLYVETKSETKTDVVAEAVHGRLKELDIPYRELESMTGIKPLKVTILTSGSFRRYFEERQAAGADLAHLKPPHMNASDTVVEKLKRMSAWKI